MNIVMYLGKTLVDHIRVEKDRISEPGYLSAYLRALKEKHSSLLEQADTEPEFLLMPVSSNVITENLHAGQITLF